MGPGPTSRIEKVAYVCLWECREAFCYVSMQWLLTFAITMRTDGLRSDCLAIR